MTLAALLIGSVFGGAVAFAGTAAAESGDDGTANAVGSDTNPVRQQVSFGENSSFREIARGDPIREPYTIEFDDASVVTVVVGSGSSTENGNYWGNVTIEDTDGDGTAQLHINTWEMGHSNPFGVKGGEITRWDQIQYEDDSTLVNKTKTTEQSAYSLLIAEGDDPNQTMASFSSFASLKVVEAETEGIDMWTAPRNTRINQPSDLWQAEGAFADSKRNFSAKPDRSVSTGDVMILSPWGGGMYGAAEHAIDETGNNASALEWLVENGYYNFSVTQTNAEDGEAKELNISRAVANGEIGFVNGLQNYHIAMSIQTDSAVFQRGGEGEFVSAEAGDEFIVEFDKTKRVDHEFEENEEGEIVDSHSPTVYENFSVVEPAVSIYELSNTSANTMISGETSLAPGTPLTVNVTVGDTTHTYRTLVNKTTTDDDDHRWNVTADLSGASSGDEVDVAVSAPGYGVFEPTIEDQPTTTTTTTGDTGTTTTDDTGTTTTDDEDDGDGGEGGKVPGFTAATALAAAIAAGLIALRRSE